MKRPIKIAGAGCCLVDQIYPHINFSDQGITRYLSRRRGDGGLHPGRLVFAEQFESFAEENLEQAIEKIAGGHPEPVMNVGGPSVVSLVHAAQLMQSSPVTVRFFGTIGNDRAGKYLREKLEQTPLALDHLATQDGTTPATIVLSDPDYREGTGERIFINSIGVARFMGPGQLNNEFFDSDIVAFGGTALVPGLHSHLSTLLKTASQKGSMTVVNTVYDFKSELERPGEKWILGDSPESYRYTDLLITDMEEAQHLSGRSDPAGACGFFREQGVKACIITNGTDPTYCYSMEPLFRPMEIRAYPVSQALVRDLAGYRGGDTTGCGDNFAGGVLASLAWQLMSGQAPLDLEECIAWGTVSGGYTCFLVGGTLVESKQGEKLGLIRPYYSHYINQIHE